MVGLVSGGITSAARLVACVGVTLVGFGLLTAPHALADVGWVSAAWSPDEDHVHFRWGYITPYTADVEALNDCRATGGEECRILASGGPCIAVFDDDIHAHWGMGDTRDEAIAAAAAKVDPGTAHLTGVHCYWE